METRKERRPKSLATQFVVLFGAAITILSAVFGYLVFENQVTLIAENSFLMSLRVGMNLKERIEDLYPLEDGHLPSGADDITSDLYDPRVTVVKVVDVNGQVLFSSDDTFEVTNDERRDIHTSVTRWEFEQREFHHDIDIGGRVMDLYLPIVAEGDMAIIQVKVSLGSVDTQMAALVRQILILIGAVFLTIGLVTLYAARRILHPISRLVDAQKALSDGDFDVSLPFRNDEIGTLYRGFRDLSMNMKRMKESALAANPLTGLPGNVEIERHLRALLDDPEPWCVLYGDLDNFKAYNDIYGFARGDDVILYTRDVLKKAFEDATGAYFIGHEGGDDFVAICTYDDWERAARHCVEEFDRGVRAYYTEEDAQKGYIDAADRSGRPTRFLLVSISIAVVSNTVKEFGNIGEIAETVAELKKYVKGISGSAYALDRRSTLRKVERAR